MHHTDEITVTIKGFSAKPRIFTLPRNRAKELEAYIESQADSTQRIPAETLFPEAFDAVKGVAMALRGLRHREELSQKQLADAVGIRQHHLSEMENAKRPIGKAMAKRLASALNANWRVLV